jgi:hypothetical protein
MGPPGTILLILLYLIVALWMLTAAATSLATYVYYRNARRLRKPPNQPAAVVLAPVKGASPTLNQFTTALLAQDYRRYRVIFIVESTGDPAYWPLADAAGLSGGRARLLVAGEAIDRGQKAHNLAAALQTLREDDEIVVFAVGDFVPAIDWLTQLTRPVIRGRAEISTGYVIMVPRSPRPANIAASLISLGIATIFSPPGARLCSGASTAIRRSTLERLDPQKFLARTLSDDLALSRAARQRGVAIHMNLAARGPTPTEHSWRSLFAYIKRQYQIVRIYAPLHWAMAAWALLISPIAIAAAILLAYSGQIAGFVALVLAAGLQQVRFVLRERALRRILDPDVIEQLEPVFRHSPLFGPLVQLVHVTAFLASATSRTIHWAGVIYRVDGPEQMTILSRGGKPVRRTPSPAEVVRR